MTAAVVHLRFLHRIRRRWIAWRVIESAGICAAFGAAVGLLIVLTLIWRREDALQPALVSLSLGAIAGMIWGISRRPTLLQTALMADRQLGLHDLLSTVMSPQQWGDDEFRDVVLMQAEASCRNRSPNDLIVQRLGGRAWGGIGIASALVLTLAMMSGRPMISSAGVETDEPQRGIIDQSVVAPHATDNTGLIATRREVTTARDENRNRADGDASGDPSGAREGNSSSRAARATSSGDGTGSAAGRTNDSAGASLPQTRVSETTPSDGGALIAGGGRAVTDGSQGQATGRTASANTGQPNIPPSQSDAWPSVQETARQTLQNGLVPDSYRDMVREYFQIDRP